MVLTGEFWLPFAINLSAQRLKPNQATNTLINETAHLY